MENFNVLCIQYIFKSVGRLVFNISSTVMSLEFTQIWKGLYSQKEVKGLGKILTHKFYAFVIFSVK